MKQAALFLFSLLSTAFRPRLSLQLEVAALRHQLAVYQRTCQRPRIQPADRILWSLLSADSLQRSPSRRPAAEVLPASPASMPKAAMRPSWEGRVEGEPTCGGKAVRSGLAPGAIPKTHLFAPSPAVFSCELVNPGC